MLRAPRPPRGWTVQYVDPRFGARSFVVATQRELDVSKRWLDAGGYTYSVEVIRG
jgi:hypothetical protein